MQSNENIHSITLEAQYWNLVCLLDTDVFRDDLDVLVGDADVLSDVGQLARKLPQVSRVTEHLPAEH